LFLVSHRSKRALIRYADDFIILCRTKSEAEQALKDCNPVLLKRGLKISKAKTRIVHVAEGFDFLGFNIRYRPRDGRDGSAIILLKNGDYSINHSDIGLYIHPSDKSILNIKKKLRDVFLSNHGSSAKSLIRQINPIIRGYAESIRKRRWHSSRTFRVFDNYLYNLCWVWIICQHPNKNKDKEWLKNRYFKHMISGPINNRWVFTDPHSKNFVYQFKWFQVFQHVMISNSMNPDDPDAAGYFVELMNKRQDAKRFSYLDRQHNILANWLNVKRIYVLSASKVCIIRNRKGKTFMCTTSLNALRVVQIINVI
jgi:RNA-directed DNA polymerase